MFDRRTDSFNPVQTYLFNAKFSDGLVAEVQVDPEFRFTGAALVQAEKYVVVVGHLPGALRVLVAPVWIHHGIQLFGTAHNSLLIHVGQEDYMSLTAFLRGRSCTKPRTRHVISLTRANAVG